MLFFVGTGFRRLGRLLVQVWNALVARSPRFPDTDLEPFSEVQVRSRHRSDISDHLPTIFLESFKTRPSLIVELGVRGGESTYVFERVSRIFDSVIVSVDLEDCGHISDYEGWHFVQGDDVAFGRDFRTWTTEHGVPSQIDVLFIDTSHLFEHTVKEIDVWFPYLATGGVALLHDTNLTAWYRRRDGSIGRGWDNDRGVVRALEQHLGLSFDESTTFRTAAGGFAIEHRPECNGLTVMRKVTETEPLTRRR